MSAYIDSLKLDGKIAFVVGGVGLLGSEVSYALSSAGAKTIIMDIDSERGQKLVQHINELGNESRFECFDCSDLEHLDAAVSKIIDSYKTVDILVNCSYPRTANWAESSFRDITLSSFRHNVDIHMNSYAWIAKLIADSMVNNLNGGSIIQLGSTYGILGQDLSVYEGTEMSENMTYSAIKGGIINLTRQLASFYGQFNIRVNSLCPGGIKGPVAGKSSGQNPIFIRNYNKKTPLRRMGTANEVAGVALFLASELSNYITGQSIIVDGGWSIV